MARRALFATSAPRLPLLPMVKNNPHRLSIKTTDVEYFGIKTWLLSS
jgi:hypothetical protein